MIKNIKNQIVVGLTLAFIEDAYTVQAMDAEKKEDSIKLLEPETVEFQLQMQAYLMMQSPEVKLQFRFREMLVGNQTDFNKWIDDVYALENGPTFLKELYSAVDGWGLYGKIQFNMMGYLGSKVCNK